MYHYQSTRYINYWCLSWAPRLKSPSLTESQQKLRNTIKIGFFSNSGISSNLTLSPNSPRLSDTVYATNTPSITPAGGCVASFRKRGTSWRAEIVRGGVRESKTFRTKAEAQAWAAEVETELRATKRGAIPNKTFGDLLDRYGKEVSSTKRGSRWELIRIEKLKRDPIANVKLADLDASHFAAWRDRCLRGDPSKDINPLSPASVRRECNLLNPAINIAVKEWRWLTENPLSDVRRPKPAKARDRRISDKEIERLMYALGYDYERTPATNTARVGAAFLFAIETAMRAGEIASLTHTHIDFGQRTAHLPKTKNGDARNVALSGEAIRIIQQLGTKGSVFHLKASSIDALFRKGKKRTMIEDLHFHDSRHEAITRLSKKLDVLDLARMVGIRDLRVLMVYYNATAAEIAKLLD